MGRERVSDEEKIAPTVTDGKAVGSPTQHLLVGKGGLPPLPCWVLDL